MGCNRFETIAAVKADALMATWIKDSVFLPIKAYTTKIVVHVLLVDSQDFNHVSLAGQQFCSKIFVIVDEYS